MTDQTKQDENWEERIYTPWSDKDCFKITKGISRDEMIELYTLSPNPTKE